MLLVVAIVKVLDGGSDGKDSSGKKGDGAGTAVQAGAQTTPTEPPPTTSAAPPPTLDAPTGPCAPKDLSVAAAVTNPQGGGDVPITLTLSTNADGACTFAVSATSVALRITSGTDRIWTTQQCPNAIAPTSVVLRKDVPAQVVVTWSGRRSDDTCSAKTKWALPGFYHAAAAAFGAEPTDMQFELLTPPPPTVTADPNAKPKKSKKK